MCDKGRFIKGSSVFALLLAWLLVISVNAQDEVDSGSLEFSEAQFIEQAREAGISEEGIAELLAARKITEPFHNIDMAVSAGWPEDLTGCLDFPDGYMHDAAGAMGHHYINLEFFNDGGVLDPLEPEALLYETLADGTLRLTGVEYVVPKTDHPRDAPPPVLFGKAMMFHPQFEAWAHHVWFWRHNPYGLFADVNPSVSCAFVKQE